MNDTLLRIQDLHLAFEENGVQKSVVQGLNLELRSGELHGIVGESGSGKSVSVMCICGLIPKLKILSGSIQYFGLQDTAIELSQADEQTFRKIRGKEIAYIFQEPMTALNPLMTCGAQVEECFDKKSKSEILHLFQQVRLPDPERIYHAYPHQISGGQRQRVMIAMAIAGNPKLLIADEPTTALDASVQAEVLQLIHELCRSRGMSLLFISHDLNVIKSITQQVTVMRKGEIMEQGKTTELFSNPKSEYTRQLISVHPNLQLKGKYLSLNGEASEFWPTLKLDEDNILSVNDLFKKYTEKKQKPVIDDISFTVNRGESLGIIGESGCGKSTLAKIIVRLEPVNRGQIVLEGKSIFDLGRNYARQVQMVFQDPFSSLNPKKTIATTLMEPMLVHGIYQSKQNRRDKAIELLNEVGLDETALNKYPHQFSGGQRQRICIARALSVEPELIICDESVSALDPTIQAQILNLLKELQFRKKLTYLFISHDLNVVNYFCDRVMVMNQGKIVGPMTPHQLMQEPPDDYSRNLIAHIH